MFEFVEVGVRLLVEQSPQRTGVVDRVQAILDRPLIAVDKNTLPVLTESYLPLVFEKYNVPKGIQEKLERWRIVAFAKGLDRHGEPRITFLYYDEDDMLILTEIQRWIPIDINLTREGVEDNEVIDLCLRRGFVPYDPGETHPQTEEL